MSDENKKQIDSLKKLRSKFSHDSISKLPKPTKKQTDELKRDFTKGVRCEECGGWHHPQVVHLDYVGHAALTDRLLDVDPLWNWEPVHTDDNGFPSLDKDQGMWIKLTICGLTRLGYGDAQGKSGPNATKERIGDALRNAGMRFGMALDLWHKGDLHADDPEPEKPKPKQEDIEPETPVSEDTPDIKYQEEIDECKSCAELKAWWDKNSHRLTKETQHTRDAVSQYWAQMVQAFKEKETANES